MCIRDRARSVPRRPCHQANRPRRTTRFAPGTRPRPATGQVVNPAGRWYGPLVSLRARRQTLVERTDLRGDAFCRAYAEAADEWLTGLFDEAAAGDAKGMALLAVGGYGRGELCPFSDLDVVLLHRGRRDISATADRIWYPVWDEGISLDHSVRRPNEALDMAAEDLRVALGLLDARVICGDPKVAEPVLEGARDRWMKQKPPWLGVLSDLVAERHRTSGDVGFLLEPDLKESHGGLRDIAALTALMQAVPVLADYVDTMAIDEARAVLTTIRVELHRRAGRDLNKLLLQEQDEMAKALGEPDADSLMLDVATAGRTVAWEGDDAWRRRGAWSRARAGRGRGRGSQAATIPLTPLPNDPGIGVADEEVVLTATADVSGDPSLSLRLAAVAAEKNLPISRDALNLLGRTAPSPPVPWPDDLRATLVRVLATGPASITALEALDQRHLLERYLPEWTLVRNNPQRNPYRQFTIDRHLLEASANAATLAHRVNRVDLLLLGTLLHDIGKGFPGDHTEVGMEVAAGIATRLGRQPEAGGEACRDLHSHFGVVAGEALADVVEQGAQQQQVDTVDPVRQGGGIGGRLEEVTVDGEPVVGVSLGLVSNRRPFGDVPLEQMALVQGFEGGDGRGSGGEYPDQRGPEVVRPGHGRGGRRAPEQVERVPRDGQVLLGGHRRQAERERRVPADVGGGGEDDLFVGEADAGVVGQRGEGNGGRLAAAPPTAAGPGPRPCPSTAPGVVALPGDGASRRGHVQHQRIGVRLSECLGHLVLFLEEQPVQIPACPPVQLDPDRGEDRPGLVYGHRVDVVGQDGHGLHQGGEGGDVPQPPVGLLQVRFEQEADIPRGAVPFGDQVGQHPEPRWLLLHPAVAGALEDGLGHLRIAADHPCIEQSERHPEVLGGHVQCFVRSSDAVVEGDPLVPHRVPDPVGGGRDVTSAAVEEDDVEVTERAELASPVATYRQEGHPLGVPRCGLIEEAGQPLVGGLGIGPTERVPAQVGPFDERLPSGSQGHERTVPPARRVHDLAGGRTRSCSGGESGGATWSVSLVAWPTRNAPGSVCSTGC